LNKENILNVSEKARLFYSLYIKIMITFEKALAEFGKKLFRKGFSIGTIK
jgi:hypothetical protein